jgi:hypothetical protein
MRIVTVVVRNRKFIRPQHIVDVITISNKLIQALKPELDMSVFWSGRTKGVSVGTKAQKFAKYYNKETVGMALQRLGIKIPTAKQNPLSWHIWELASKLFATRTCGEVNVVLGKKSLSGSVWMKIEKPTLMKNLKVTKITEHKQWEDRATEPAVNFEW